MVVKIGGSLPSRFRVKPSFLALCYICFMFCVRLIWNVGYPCLELYWNGYLSAGCGFGILKMCA